MLKFGNKEFKNLQEQVLSNANEILEIKQSLGDALPNPIAGPQGPQGDKGQQGDKGKRGSIWTVGTDLPGMSYEGDMHLMFDGRVYRYDVNKWVLVTNIAGPQGPQGNKGIQGEKGEQGEQGEQGPIGESSPIYKLYEKLANVAAFQEKYGDANILPSDYAVLFTDTNEIYGIVVNLETGVHTLEYLCAINGIVNVVANTSATPTVALENIQIGETVYFLDAENIVYNNKTVSEALANVGIKTARITYTPYGGITSIDGDVEISNLSVDEKLYVYMNESNPLQATNMAYVDHFYNKTQNEIKDLELALFGSIWTESTATYDNLNVATVDRDDNGYPIVSNQFGAIQELKAFSYVENQLLITPTIQTQTLNGITLTNNEDGTLTLSGTATADTTFTLMGNLSRNIPLGHKIFITNFKNPSSSTYYLFDAYESNITFAMESSPNGYIKTKEGSSTTISPRIRVQSGATINETIRPKYVDLTLMFGAGNEPTTVEEFNNLGIAIPDTYTEPNIVDVRPSKLSSYDTDNQLLGEIAITLPASFKSANKAKDYVKLVEKSNGLYDVIAVSNVGSVDLGTLNWSNTTDYPSRFTSTSLQSEIKDFTGTSNIPNILCSKYGLDTPYNIWRATNDKTISLYPSGTNIWILAVDTSYTTASDFKTAMSGVILHYEKATPTETTLLSDVSLDDIKARLQRNGTIALDNKPCDTILKVVAYKPVED